MTHIGYNDAPKPAQRPVLMSLELADVHGLTGRMKNAGDSGIGVVWVDEDDLLAKAPEGCYIEWGYPDAHGRFTPTVYTGPRP